MYAVSAFWLLIPIMVQMASSASHSVLVLKKHPDFLVPPPSKIAAYI